MTNLSTTYLGLNLKNPLIAGSSGLTDNVETIKAIEDNGAAAVVLKSIFEEEIIAEMEANLQKMSSTGFIYPETLEFYENNYAHEEITEQYLKLIRDAKQAVSIPVIASINCVTSNEWTYFPKQIAAAGADALELNVFIMPSEFSRSSEVIEQVYFDIIKTVKTQVAIPISLKVSYYFTNLGVTLQQLSKTGIDGLVLFNRFYNPDFDIENFEVRPSNILSSRSDLPISLRWIAIMAERVDCNLAASTGIHDGNAVIKQLLAGANAVQVVSALYTHGLGHIKTMLNNVSTWMQEHNFESIDAFRGKMSQAQSQNPAAYERVQFMKYFREYKP